MGFRFICPRTGHEIEATFEIDDEDLMVRRESIATQCSFCGGSHEWVSQAHRAKTEGLAASVSVPTGRGGWRAKATFP
jgi:hypothetical protein